jgi:hypothetical protein
MLGLAGSKHGASLAFEQSITGGPAEQIAWTQFIVENSVE